jgi:mono/diheme cytochrome c family protein
MSDYDVAAFATGGDLAMGLLGKLKRKSIAAGFFVLLLTILMAPMANAQEDPGEDVYQRICSACHGSTGAGLSGTFPPLAGNPNVQDAAYVEGVVTNGKDGELVVGGVTYNGVMPSFGDQLTAEEVTAVIDYVQNRLGVSSSGEATPVDEGEAFPWNLVMLGSAQTVFVVGFLFLFTSPRRKKELTWWHAYGRAILIFLFFVLATTWLPSWLLTQETVAGWPRLIGDLLGSGLWMVMLAVGIGGLIWLQRAERI